MTQRDEKDGGPAFPGDESASGMYLRDWFAGQALASVPLRAWDQQIPEDQDKIEAWAKLSYAIADALLAERDKR